MIKSAPIILRIENNQETRSNFVEKIKLFITSSSLSTLDNLAVVIKYPLGFTFISANPEPQYNKNIFKIIDLKPNETKEIEILGKIQGQKDEEKNI